MRFVYWSGFGLNSLLPLFLGVREMLWRVCSWGVWSVRPLSADSLGGVSFYPQISQRWALAPVSASPTAGVIIKSGVGMDLLWQWHTYPVNLIEALSTYTKKCLMEISMWGRSLTLVVQTLHNHLIIYCNVRKNMRLFHFIGILHLAEGIYIQRLFLVYLKW